MNQSRKLFGQPIRKDTTLEFYPDKITLDHFIDEINQHIIPFMQNMRGLGIAESKYIEEWYEIWLAWNEVEQENV